MCVCVCEMVKNVAIIKTCMKMKLTGIICHKFYAYIGCCLESTVGKP